MVKLITVCKFCGEHDKEEATIEFNFREEKIYFVCPKCNKTNELRLKAAITPLPRIRRM